jgi:hypothetical protein
MLEIAPDGLSRPELLAEAGKMNVDVNPSTGAQSQALVDKMYKTPEAIIERMRVALGRNK